VYSEPDSGTVVKLYFPAAGKLDSAAEIPDSDAAVKPRKTEPKEHTILFVEDDPALLELNTAILKRLGYSVISTSSAAEALQLAEGRTDPVDLLITDVVMPQMNGKKLAEKMQKIYPDMQCLYVSGYTANVIAHHGILDDDINFIQKPFSIEKLSAVLEDILKD
jgi:DNA-binding NtrC family response regulator